MRTSDTIYALSTPFGKSGVAVFRISGPNSLNVASFLGLSNELLSENGKTYGKITNPLNDIIIDHVLALYFKSPKSFTGDDVIEIHTHGSIAVIKTLLEVLSKSEARMAEPGEYSRRAFLNGKIDLTQAEGIADIIDAETEIQLVSANQNLGGQLKDLYEGWRKELLGTLSLIEAFIDFPEEDIPEDIVNDIVSSVDNLRNDIHGHLNDSNRGEKIRSGIKVAIVGEPNVGKSTLINAITKREVAIVSDIAGTTRDAIDVIIDIEGYPFIFTDTAGIRETDDTIEKIGVEIARKKLTEADLVLEILSPNNIQPIAQHDNKLVVINKSDTISKKDNPDYIYISAKNNDISNLIEAIKDFASQFEPSDDPVITRARYREHLQNALYELEEFTLDLPIELAGEHLRRAMYEIGKITGLVKVDEILDIIFSSFCIGK
ncbi:MAG: tRNA uridine-5-carboxymethylaminomethyl(34) synthesis GTPase MnmE [Alphaproteobacteria bacterium]|nr:tRNA uridine-5-carboxymethylaminomethyl(34) synthesis GTPase MnmE [Alphaproteobacteria bacterium]OJV15099.1 MAG: tRNA uridine-5-carboxymethylaminomethyl(34) synthesis GTPase MnmE [Alphaproteobacteria bacterium 33-17]